MAPDYINKLASQAVEVTKHYFANLTKESKEILPPVLKQKGIWIGNYDNHSIGVFYLTKDELDRVNKNINQGLPAFPGLFVSEKNKPEKSPIAISAGGKCNYFSSNYTSNMVAFSIPEGSSFTVIDHYQELTDSNGQTFKYKVDLAFFIGAYEEEVLADFEPRLLELLNHSLEVWRNAQ